MLNTILHIILYGHSIAMVLYITVIDIDRKGSIHLCIDLVQLTIRNLIITIVELYIYMYYNLMYIYIHSSNDQTL